MSDALDELLPAFRAAVDRYEMIQPGDAVAVGLSGGKDSVLLVGLLARLRRFYPAPFTVTAITLDPCFENRETDYAPVTAFCESMDVPHIIQRTQLYHVVFEERQEPNPCSLCARMRRGTLHKAAKDAGCNVIALGHHQDDAAETIIMNLFAGGTVGCFSPKSHLTRRDLWMIRPMIFLREQQVISAARRMELPIVKSRCPVDGKTHRQQTKELLTELSRQYGSMPERLTGALQKGHISGW